jgi:hypothetical protein
MFGHVKYFSWQLKMTTSLYIWLPSYHKYTRIINKINIVIRKALVFKLYHVGDSIGRRPDLSSGRPSGPSISFFFMGSYDSLAAQSKSPLRHLFLLRPFYDLVTRCLKWRLISFDARRFSCLYLLLPEEYFFRLTSQRDITGFRLLV